MLPFMLDVDAVADEGPFSGTVASNVSASGKVATPFRTFTAQPTDTGRAPRGGIEYIDRNVGGVTGPRVDAEFGPRGGIRPLRARTGVFDGRTIGRQLVLNSNIVGQVGKNNRNQLSVRARGADMTNLPDDASVSAQFLNPALSALINKYRKR